LAGYRASVAEGTGTAETSSARTTSAAPTTTQLTPQLAKAMELLRRTSLLGGLAEEDLRRLAERSVSRRYRRGQVVFTEGDPSESLMIVAEGRVKVLSISDDGRDHVLNVLEPGETLGELSIADGGPRSASVEALDACTLLVLERRAILELLRERPEVAEQLLKALGAHVRRLTGHTADLVFLDLPRRVAKLLLYRYRDSGRPVIELGLNQTELAAMLGGSRQSVNQAMREFEKRGWIVAEGQTITMLDDERMRRYAGD
jgi:CRP-like cAMP-binding protein